MIANNSDLKAIEGFPKLKTIVGALDFAGAFDYVVLNSLSDVRGGSNVQTSSTNETICKQFNTAHDKGVIKGVNTCITNKANPESNPTSTGGGSSPSSTGSSDSAASVVGPALSFTGLAAMIAALLFI